MPPAFENIQWQVYIVFAVFCTAMFVHVLFMFPETAGKTLEEVEDLFTDPSGPRGVGTPAWKTHISTKRVLAAEKGQVTEREKRSFSRPGQPGAREDVAGVRHSDASTV